MQTAARFIDRSVWAVTVLAVVLLAASIAVSPNRRRTIIQLALGVVAGLVATLLLARQIEDAILARITDPDGIRAVASLLHQLGADLRAVTSLIVVAALVVGIVAYVADRPDEQAAGSDPLTSG